MEGLVCGEGDSIEGRSHDKEWGIEKERADEIGVTRNRKVMELLHDAERQHGFRIIFACETGSRCYGLETRDSDVDVKGMFVYSPSTYLSVEKRISYLKLNHEMKLFGNTDLDLELVDLRKYLRARCKLTSFDEAVMWLRNPNPYINLLSPSLVDALISSQVAPLFQIQSKIIKYQAKFEKALNPSEPNIIVAKDVLNSIVQSFQILSVVLAAKSMPSKSVSVVTVSAITLNFEASASSLKQAITECITKEGDGDDKLEEKNRLKEMLAAVEDLHTVGKEMFELKKISNQSKIAMSNPILKPYFAFLRSHVLTPAYVDRVPTLGLISESNALFSSLLVHVFPEEM